MIAISSLSPRPAAPIRSSFSRGRSWAESAFMAASRGILTRMSRGPRVLLCLSLLFVPFLASACGYPPTREMDQAQGALDAARAAGADRYAVDEYTAAASALKSAQDAVAQRDYRLALNHALDSRERAQAAAKQAADQQAAQRSAAERRLTEATALLAIANEKLAAARTARVPARQLAPPRSAIIAGDSSLQKAGT